MGHTQQWVIPNNGLLVRAFTDQSLKGQFAVKLFSIYQTVVLSLTLVIAGPPSEGVQLISLFLLCIWDLPPESFAS